jgi:hypothetical protein
VLGVLVGRGAAATAPHRAGTNSPFSLSLIFAATYSSMVRRRSRHLDWWTTFPNAFPNRPPRISKRGRCGCIVPVIQGNDVELRSNECGTVVGVFQVGILRDLISMIPSKRG